jgi:hypothetical protein
MSRNIGGSFCQATGNTEQSPCATDRFFVSVFFPPFLHAGVPQDTKNYFKGSATGREKKKLGNTAQDQYDAYATGDGLYL